MLAVARTRPTRDNTSRTQNLPHSDRDESAEEELACYEKETQVFPDIRLLPKTHARTWWNGSAESLPGSDLDRVFGPKNLGRTQSVQAAERK